MKLCFNQATTLENSDLKKDLDLCNKHGYDYIEIRSMDKLPEYLENHSIEELKEYFKTHHIKPLALNALVFFNNRNKKEEEAIIDEFKEMLKIGKTLGIPYIVAVPLVTDKKILLKDIRNSSISVLTELSDLAEPYGIKIALEFLGHPQATINTFEQAYDIITAVDRDNVGLVFDCFHFHGMGSSLEALRNADGSKVFILHVNDTDDYPIGMLTDEDRVWPGHGAIKLDEMLTILKEIGYDGAASVELFRPDYYKLDPEEVIKSAKDTTIEVVSKCYTFQ